MPGGAPSITAVLHAPGEIRLEERHEPDPGPGEVQVRVRATGLCGSDLHYYLHGRNGNFAMRSPLVLGHESSGDVLAVGAGVVQVKPGDRVAIEAGVPCKKCEYCKEGRYNLCKGMQFRSSAKVYPHFDGLLRQVVNHPADMVYKIPDSMSYHVAALLEPFSVSLHALRRAMPLPGSTSFVYGAGAVGLLTAALCKYYGASRVIIADIDDGRLEFAVQNGYADEKFLVPMGKYRAGPEAIEEGQEVVSQIVQLSGADGFDVTWECTGVETSVQKAIATTKAGGKAVFIGMGTPVQTFPLGAATLREVDVIGVFRYANTYPAAIRIANSGRLPDLSKLVTHTFNLQESTKAFETARTAKDTRGALVVKVMVESRTM